MKLRNIIILLITLSVSMGCSILSSGEGYYENLGHLRFRGHSTGLDSGLDIDGYYWSRKEVEPVRFFYDGIATCQGSAGVYKLTGDTITLDVYDKPGLMKGWSRFTCKFVLESRTSIRMVELLFYDGTSSLHSYKPSTETIYELYGAPGPFSQYADTAGIRKQKWLWECEEDWKQWMDAHKQERARNKVGKKDNQIQIGRETPTPDNPSPPKSKKWDKGLVYAAPLWVGYKQGNNISRIGFHHKLVQRGTQIFIHSLIGSKYYTDYSQMTSGFYSYYGTINPFNLWNY